MSIHRRAAKRDAIEPEIIDALREVGASVWQLSDEGVPDLLVNFRGDTYLLEVKMPKGKLTSAQEVFFDTWQGDNLFMVISVDKALRAIGVIE